MIAPKAEGCRPAVGVFLLFHRVHDPLRPINSKSRTAMFYVPPVWNPRPMAAEISWLGHKTDQLKPWNSTRHQAGPKTRYTDTGLGTRAVKVHSIGVLPALC